ncbi:DEAD/DEAH box helicase family protein [Anabaena sphaerica FACHB-251]|uniref:DEAD/DEAH box helicase family protein n=1 Tax=Anabaena sphaerica FACHB-251 TaxID=2692883 RepID=A0A926ZZ11_9NOST|nr:DEAD/DEAH box helicase family protein [Anabaena sphaerica]MBD2292011.1 DEAD/DEAH box helicase family protein [Anabaena sphaerica FACHB-251]
MSANEANTRTQLIDPALTLAGWNIKDSNQVGLEIPVDGYNAEPWNGVTDYCLYQPNGEVIAVVEAKRQSSNPKIAQTQVEYYVKEIEKHQSFRPFAFMTNGEEIYFWDVGNSAKRQVAGFFSPSDLENLLYIRQNKIALSSLPINTQIAGRDYQQEAIRRVCETFDEGKRRTLLVMATGTGKTRTAMAIIDLFLKANQSRKILFVADRDNLVKQALEDGFMEHIPHEPCDRIFSYNIDKTKRLYVVVEKTLRNSYKKFSPAFFDLIIFDEAHRSIFNLFQEVMEYFDGRMIGLTATPAGFIDRNTFNTFHCFDGIPTFLYTYKQAIEEKNLVDFSLYQAQTKFQSEGIKGAKLSEEEQNILIAQGHDPDDIDFSGTDLEKKVSNKDTLRKQWEEIMEVCHKDESGQLPAKTIVFALTQKHALRLCETFEEMYPQYSDLVRVITHKTEYKGKLTGNFKKEDMPRIAISVDMLDTGVDVPEIMNLVFMKPVQSQIKLWQMIGRGTRNQKACKKLEWLPNRTKQEFLIIDFWENEFEAKVQTEVAQTIPVLQRIFNTRLDLLELYLHDQESPECQTIIASLREQITQIPTDSFTVKKKMVDIAEVWTDLFWNYITKDKLKLLRFKLAPLLRFVPGVEIAAATFTSKIERLKLEIQTEGAKPDTVQSIAEDVSRLPDFVHQDKRKQNAIKLCLSSRLNNATVKELNQIINDLAEEMKNRRQRPSIFLELDLADFVATRGFITVGEGGEQVYVEEYKKRVEEKINEIVDNHPTIKAIQEGEAVTDWQLIELERTLRQGLGGGNIQLSESNIRKAYGLKANSLLAFLRHLLDLDAIPDYEEVVKRQFEEFIAKHQYNANQINFLRAVQSVFLQKRRLEVADLYEGALARFGKNAVDRFFSDDEVNDLLVFTELLAA